MIESDEEMTDRERLNSEKEHFLKMQQDAYKSIEEKYRQIKSEYADWDAMDIKDKLEEYFAAQNASVNDQETLVAEAKKQRKRKINENIKATIATSLTVMAYFFGLTSQEEREDIWYLMKQNLGKPVIEHFMQDSKEDVLAIRENTANMNADYNIGDEVIIKDAAKIYEDYRAAALQKDNEALNSYWNEQGSFNRKATGFGYAMPDGTLRFASNASEEEELERLGGKVVSLQAQDGYYNITDTEVDKNARR